MVSDGVASLCSGIAWFGEFVGVVDLCAWRLLYCLFGAGFGLFSYCDWYCRSSDWLCFLGLVSYYLLLVVIVVVVIVVGFVVFVDYLLFCGSGDCCYLWFVVLVVVGLGGCVGCGYFVVDLWFGTLDCLLVCY